ncbi:MAG: flagellar biosynthesis protein FlhA [Candidatus Carbobacillus altaicus]|uniref:Flagellar biosynthesis protein FlhA n=1 Tax=Candidatus Carbonibacillus altaicus TaxID=2163959 RepID=A0A2R6Y4U4_9BACL|nr:flagellar biosynthesis protein FlhA [Candidatus Carbobacillus altaicus]PTQ57709.1 MAG: Flagellar biosynthesis protein FlhA [Candidatus Carbobacillus altaicus]
MFRELTLFIGIIAVVMMMVIPVPPALLDFLILINLSFSLVILLVSLSMKEPLEFSVFPTLLLITTLFRLSLNVSTTRSILSKMNGGEVIHTFGSFVVGGEPVIGLIVFLILVIVQFLVITKGSERVAEVAARFTLDAMPGKQMAIDADLNAGIIDEKTAQARRQAIEKEADFYGAMDGATKFVKGDAIAAMLILAINIIGGLIIGVVIHGKTLAESASIYTVLSVGEGLVAQLPALFVSTATGIVVTRTASQDGLTSDVMQQLFRQAHLLYVVAGVLFLLGVATPIPFWATTPLALIIAYAAYRTGMRQKEVDVPVATDTPERRAEEAARPESALSLLDMEPIEFEFGYALIPLADPKQGGDLMDRMLMLRRQLALTLGFIVPTIRLRDNLQLAPRQYVIKIRGEVVGEGTVMEGRLMAIGGEHPNELPGDVTKEPTFGMTAVWIDPSYKDEAEFAGWTVVDPSSVIITHLTERIKKHAWELLGRDETKTLVEHLRKSHAALVADLESVLTLGDIQKVLSSLLREGLSIRNLPLIFETLADHGSKVKDPALLTEFVRQALSRQITAQYAPKTGPLNVIYLSPALEQKILENVKRTDFGDYVALSPDDLKVFFDHIREGKEQLEMAGYTPIILTSPGVRRYVRDLVSRLFPEMVVLSYNELDPSLDVKSVSVVNAS